MTTNRPNSPSVTPSFERSARLSGKSQIAATMITAPGTMKPAYS
jgi:hypothetical protein